jgi:hypothetical protein
MAIVTTYICDITGKAGEKKDFVELARQHVATQPMHLRLKSWYTKILH